MASIRALTGERSRSRLRCQRGCNAVRLARRTQPGHVTGRRRVVHCRTLAGTRRSARRRAAQHSLGADPLRRCATPVAGRRLRRRRLRNRHLEKGARARLLPLSRPAERVQALVSRREVRPALEEQLHTPGPAMHRRSDQRDHAAPIGPLDVGVRRQEGADAHIVTALRRHPQRREARGIREVELSASVNEYPDALAARAKSQRPHIRATATARGELVRRAGGELQGGGARRGCKAGAERAEAGCASRGQQT